MNEFILEWIYFCACVTFMTSHLWPLSTAEPGRCVGWRCRWPNPSRWADFDHYKAHTILKSNINANTLSNLRRYLHSHNTHSRYEIHVFTKEVMCYYNTGSGYPNWRSLGKARDCGFVCAGLKCGSFLNTRHVKTHKNNVWKNGPKWQTLMMSQVSVKHTNTHL